MKLTSEQQQVVWRFKREVENLMQDLAAGTITEDLFFGYYEMILDIAANRAQEAGFNIYRTLEIEADGIDGLH